MGFSCFVDHPPVGRSGGLVLAWKLGVDLEVMQMNSHFINIIMYSDDPLHHG